ncbi:MAG: metallophosphoesterase family protein [Candidatus Omnitrophica bacterium]|nr:metallophosphoesterase family protein [Candidatus Omnitrophota bacterium]
MMRIGVVSDTHSLELPRLMLKDFKSVDLIIHAGDFCDTADYEALAQIKEVKAVYGNMDTPAIRKLFPRRQIIKLGAFSVGLFHGEGPPKTILEKVKSEFKDDKVDMVIFGHSHQPFNQIIGHVRYFNPGSPNDKIFAPYCSYGIVEVANKDFSVKHVNIK